MLSEVLTEASLEEVSDFVVLVSLGVLVFGLVGGTLLYVESFCVEFGFLSRFFDEVWRWLRREDSLFMS